MKSTRMLAILVLALVAVLPAGVANADFTFGAPENLGPTVNSPALDGAPSVTADGLSLFFNSQRSGGYDHYDIWVSTRQTTGDPWGEPVNLGQTINTSSLDGNPIISPDGLTLYFTSNRPGGYDGWDIYVTTRATVSDPWSAPVNLGPPFSSSASDHGVSTTADGLSLYFGSDRTGNGDIYTSTRATVDDPWGEPVNLGPVVNSPSVDGSAMVSADGLSMYFHSNRPGGYGGFDIWVTTRATTDDDWGTPVNLGPIVNTSTFDGAATISADCSTLYFMSGRPGGTDHDLWQVSIELIVDFNGDGIVDSADMCIMVDYWGTDESLCDISPMPWGDGIVDVQDLIVLAEHLFEEVSDPTLLAHWALDETEGITAYDKAAANNASVFGGAAWQPTGGMIGGALQLDGVDDWVFSRSVQNLGEELFSILAWIKGGAPNQVVMSQPLVAGWLMADSEGRLMTEMGDTGPSGGPLVSGAVITDGEWHRIGLVRDGFHRKLYVDGVTVAQDSQAGPGISDSGLNIGVGKNYMPGTYWSGLIDDVRIYNRAVKP